MAQKFVVFEQEILGVKVIYIWTCLTRLVALLCFVLSGWQDEIQGCNDFERAGLRLSVED